MPGHAAAEEVETRRSPRFFRMKTHLTLRLAFWLRWLAALAWCLVAVIYLDWLFAPLMHGRQVEGGWWYPSRFVFYAWKSRTDLDWFRFGDTGLTGVLGNSLDPQAHKARYAALAGGLVVLAALSAWMFLALGRQWLRELPAKRRPTTRGILASSLMAGTLSAAGIALLLDTLGAWDWVVLGAPRFLLKLAGLGPFAPDGASVWPGLVILFLGCVFWAAVFSASWAYSTRYWQFERMTLGLLVVAAAIVLLTITLRFQLPVFTPATEIDGRYTAAVLATTVLLWAWGCRVLLLFQLKHFERMRNSVACYACGYDLTGTLAAKRRDCPECGTGIGGYQRGLPTKLGDPGNLSMTP